LPDWQEVLCQSIYLDGSNRLLPSPEPLSEVEATLFYECDQQLLEFMISGEFIPSIEPPAGIACENDSDPFLNIGTTVLDGCDENGNPGALQSNDPDGVYEKVSAMHSIPVPTQND